LPDDANSIPPKHCKLLRRKHILALIPVTEATLWNWVKAGKFPKPIQLVPGQLNSPIAWYESEVDAWFATRERGFGPSHDPMAAQVSRSKQAFRARRRKSIPHVEFKRMAPIPGEKPAEPEPEPESKPDQEAAE
jgi:prophage regulatory protein